jgi:hypothetical protein
MHVSVQNAHLSSRMGLQAVGLLFVSVVLFLSTGLSVAHSEEAKASLKTGHALLLNAYDQLEIAIHFAELAVSPHQTGLGWHRAHIQRAINALVGEKDPRFDKTVENPGDGHGAIAYLKEARKALTGCRPLNACEAIESTLSYISAAIDHAEESLKVGNRAGLSQRQARLFGALLVVARGDRLTVVPTTGAMAYAIRAIELEQASF